MAINAYSSYIPPISLVTLSDEALWVLYNPELDTFMMDVLHTDGCLVSV